MATNNKIDIVISAKDLASSVIKNTADVAVNSFKVVGTAALAASVAAAGMAASFAGFGVKQALDLEQVSVAFETMLGSAEAAQKALKSVADTAKTTPYELKELQTTARQLFVAGIGEDKMIEKLRMIGDVAAGVSAPIQDIAFVYGQVRQQQQAYTQDLNQFASRGIGIYEEVSKILGITVQQLREGMGNGTIAVGFETVDQALQNLTIQGGKFFNLMESQSGTAAGLISNIKDSVSQLALELVGVSTDGVITEGGVFDRFKDTLLVVLDYLNQNKDTITSLADALINGLATGFTMASSAYQGLLQWLNDPTVIMIGTFVKDVFTAAMNGLIFSWQTIQPELIKTYELLKPILTVFGAITGVIFSGLIVGISYLAGPVIGGLLKAFNEVLAVINQVISSIGWAYEAFTSFFDTTSTSGIGQALKDLVNKFIDDFNALSFTIPVINQDVSLPDIPRFAKGGDFVTSGPQLMMVGDNPGGKERVQVTPLSSPNYNGPQGGNNIVININGASNPMAIAQEVRKVLAQYNQSTRLGLNPSY